MSRRKSTCSDATYTLFLRGSDLDHSQLQPATVSDKLKLVIKALHDRKVEDLTVLDVSALVSYTDHFVIGSGNSSTHVSALADAAISVLKKPGGTGVHNEADSQTTWVLIDGKDFLVHLFQPAARKFYRLEDLWLDAPKIHFDLE